MTPRRRWQSLSLRARLTATAVAVLAAGASLGLVGLLHLIHDSLVGSVEDATRLEAAGVVQLVHGGLSGPQLPSPRADGVAQLVDANGRVLASSLPGSQPPISALHPGAGQTIAFRLPRLPVSNALRDADPDRDGDNAPFLVVASAVPGSPTTVFVAESLAAAERSQKVVTLSLSAALPVFVTLAGLLVWFLTGRVLRPVERIRVAVADISASRLHRRVAVRGTGDEIDRLARTMNDMLDRLERATLQQRRFIADASHELRSPVTSIRAMLEAALAARSGGAAPGADATWRATAGEVLDETGRMQRIVEDLLLLARADEGTLRPRREQVDLDDIVLDEARRLRQRGRVAVDASAVSGGRVMGDAHHLARMVRNLSDNAERHAASTVRLALHGDGSTVRLEVSDDGPGIAAEHREEVFERFARLHDSRGRDHGGTGLGLAIVRELAAAHGGLARVADVAPGAHLVVELPEAGSGAAAAHPGRAPAAVRPGRTGGPGVMSRTADRPGPR